MSSGFDPSPRASKRRKTTQHDTEQTILPNGTPQASEEDASAMPLANGSNSVTPNSQASKRKTTKKVISIQSPAQEIERPEESATDDDVEISNGTPSKAPRQSAGSNHQLNGHESGSVVEIVDSQNGSDEEVEQQESAGQTNEPAEDNDTPKVRSSGRQRKQPSRYTSATKNSSTGKPARKSATQAGTPSKRNASPVKGILTPSRKQKTPGPRKSVMFDQNEAAIGEQLGFKDIGTPAKGTAKETPEKRPPRKTALLARELLQDHGVVEEVEQQEQQEIDDLTINIPEEDVIIPDLEPDSIVSVAGSTEENDHVQRIKASILSRLTSTTLPDGPPAHLESQFNELHSLLRSTIVSSESNSLLLLGPRGAGKSMLLSLALRALTDEHSSDFHTVQLNGFLQTDDRLALREIWRQLGREMQVDEMETEDVAASYADTMASLLSLLSHPDEMTVDDQNGADDIENLASNAVQIAGGGQRTSKSIVFILDEFDLFTNHPRQTLLYNLFDIAQSRKAPIVVVGCSTRMDVIECLEKRVKSRFSHRWLLVPNCRTFLEWETLVKEALLANDQARLLQYGNEQTAWVKQWNKYIETTFLPSRPIQTLLKSHFYTTKSLPDLFTSLYPLIATLTLPPSSSSSQPTPTPIPSSTSLSQPTLLTLLPTLPTLHTTLLISTSRLHTIHHLPSINFNLIYTHYTELIAQSRLRQSAAGSLAVSGSLRAWGRETCRGAWEDLGRWGMITAVVGGRDADGGIDGDGDEWETRMWRGEVTLDEVAWAVKVGGSGGDGLLLERWCREI